MLPAGRKSSLVGNRRNGNCTIAAPFCENTCDDRPAEGPGRFFDKNRRRNAKGYTASDSHERGAGPGAASSPALDPPAVIGHHRSRCQARHRPAEAAPSAILEPNGNCSTSSRDGLASIDLRRAGALGAGRLRRAARDETRGLARRRLPVALRPAAPRLPDVVRIRVRRWIRRRSRRGDARTQGVLPDGPRVLHQRGGRPVPDTAVSDRRRPRARRRRGRARAVVGSGRRGSGAAVDRHGAGAAARLLSRVHASLPGTGRVRGRPGLRSRRRALRRLRLWAGERARRR